MTRRHRRRLLATLATATAAALAVLAAGPARPAPLAGEAPRDGFVRIPGAIHVHTTHSDGAGTPERVAQAARRAGLSFLVITDHNTDGARPFSGYRDGVLVMVGAEISTHQGHLLGLGMRPLAFPPAQDARNVLDDVHHLGGAAFVAHPASSRDGLEWSGWALGGGWGLEVLNLDSLWRQASWPAFLRAVAAWPFDAAYALSSSLGRPEAVMARWDALLRRRAAAGLAGVDAHGFPSYDGVFRVLRNYVLLDAPFSGAAERDAAAVDEALARGRSYMALEALAPAGGFFFHAVRGEETWQMGDTAAPAPDLLLRAGGRLPRGARIDLYRNGERIAGGQGVLEVPAARPGAYRVEVRPAGREALWLLSNPIYVYGGVEKRIRARRAAWPPPAPPPPALARPLDAFAPGSALAAESDAGTWVDSDVRVPGRGGDPEGGGARLRFRLDRARPAPRPVWGALVERSRRDLSRDTGLVFDVRGDGEYRVRVALWEERPGGPGGEPDWWQSSVRTSTEWRRHAVPFERLQPAATNVDRRLDLRRITGLVFYIDPATGDYATEGAVRFDRLGVY